MSPASTEGPSFARLREQVRLAGVCGLEAVWCLPSTDTEGRFEQSAPELWLSALASATEGIRLGWGVAGMTPPERAPLGVAEQAASLDLACEGRLDLAFLPDGELIDAPPRAVSGWDEGIRMLVEMWDAPRFSWRSPRFDLKPIDVLPKPVQKPHPPLWLVGWHVDHAARAGAHGLGFLDVSGGPDEALELHRSRYLESRTAADVHDLVCESAFAAALDVPTGGDPAAFDPFVRRLAGWENIGIDQAVVRIDWLDRGHGEIMDAIRLLASAGGTVADPASEHEANPQQGRGR